MPLDIGIEIECLVPAAMDMTLPSWDRNPRATRTAGETFARLLIEAGVDCYFAGYTHARTGSWKIVTDASISAGNLSGYVGLEFVSPPLNDATADQITTVCRVLQANNVKTNRSCGLHVHIGARNLTVTHMKQLAKLFADNEEVIDGLLPPSRRANNNSYCRSLKSRIDNGALSRAYDVAGIQHAVTTGLSNLEKRYMKLNFAAYFKHKTVEFRNHSGTIDPVKILKWAHFCQKLVDVSQQPSEASPTANPSDSYEVQRRMRRAKAAATIFRLCSRPEGATPEECRLALNRSSQIRPAIDLMRIGVQWTVDGRRNGQKVYKIAVNSSTEPATLAGLLAKLSMTPEDQAFWEARAALLLGRATASVPNSLSAAATPAADLGRDFIEPELNGGRDFYQEPLTPDDEELNN